MYECHITVPAARRNEAIKVAAQRGWKTSEIARDPILGDGTYFYLTSHDDNLITLHGRMSLCALNLREWGVPVIRQKIEMIVYDTKTGIGV